MQEACRRCPHKDICQIKSPTSATGSRIDSRFSNCVHYTCTEGKNAAIAALHSDKAEISFVAEGGKTVVGILFGSRHKATQLATSRYRRFVTERGEIYSQELDKVAQLTAVKVR